MACGPHLFMIMFADTGVWTGFNSYLHFLTPVCFNETIYDIVIPIHGRKMCLFSSRIAKMTQNTGAGPKTLNSNLNSDKLFHKNHHDYDVIDA